jgi:hypothetical protein
MEGVSIVAHADAASSNCRPVKKDGTGMSAETETRKHKRPTVSPEGFTPTGCAKFVLENIAPIRNCKNAYKQ